MMECPYCLSPVQDEASVCKVCAREIHLFRPLLARIQALEAQSVSTDTERALRRRIAELESQLCWPPARSAAGVLDTGLMLVEFFVLPWTLLLLGHVLITVSYDLPMLFLQVLVVAVPLLFGAAWQLRGGYPHQGWVVVWVSVMSLAAVLGMSATTAQVDHIPVLPRHLAEWTEFMAYALGIGGSYGAGIALVRWWQQHRPLR